MAIVDVTYETEPGQAQVDELLGPRPRWKGWFRRERIGPPRMPVEAFSAGFQAFLAHRPHAGSAGLYRRPQGILVEVTGPALRLQWAVPYYLLSIYKSEHLAIHAGGQYLKLRCETNASKTIRDLLDEKARFMGEEPTNS